MIEVLVLSFSKPNSYGNKATSQGERGKIVPLEIGY